MSQANEAVKDLRKVIEASMIKNPVKMEKEKLELKFLLRYEK